VVEFNDEAALAAALAPGDVACVLAEPVMTNIGMVLPASGFLEKLRDMTEKTGTLLILDETHTLSSGPGGYARAAGCGPTVSSLASPLPAAFRPPLYGFSTEVAARIRDYLAKTARTGPLRHRHNAFGLENPACPDQGSAQGTISQRRLSRP
jgi:glutamate-1-semialdehyde 2,1-aminomutase